MSAISQLCYTACNALLLYCKKSLVSSIVFVGSNHTVTLTWFGALPLHPPLPWTHKYTQAQKHTKKERKKTVEIIHTIKSRQTANRGHVISVLLVRFLDCSGREVSFVLLHRSYHNFCNTLTLSSCPQWESSPTKSKQKKITFPVFLKVALSAGLLCLWVA